MGSFKMFFLVIYSIQVLAISILYIQQEVYGPSGPDF